jgi:hypothetical protein
MMLSYFSRRISAHPFQNHKNDTKTKRETKKKQNKQYQNVWVWKDNIIQRMKRRESDQIENLNHEFQFSNKEMLHIENFQNVPNDQP